MIYRWETDLISNKMTKCVIYQRTNSGDDTDSSQQQEHRCLDYCTHHHLQVTTIFHDQGVSGQVSVFKRQEFKRMYLYCLEQDVKTIVFDTISRLSPNSLELELGYRRLKQDGFTLISVTDGGFEDNQTSKRNRRILSAISE